jgi:hypothetical protein
MLGGGAVLSASRAAWGGPIAERRDGKAAHVAGNAAVVPIRSHDLKNCPNPQRARRLAPRLPAGQHQGRIWRGLRENTTGNLQGPGESPRMLRISPQSWAIKVPDPLSGAC